MKSLLIVFLLFFVYSKSEATSSLCKINHPSDSRVEWECRRIQKGETIEKLFGDKWKDIIRFNRVDRRHIYPGIYIKVLKRFEDIKNFAPVPDYYQPAESEPKFILVNLTEQFLGAYEYGHLVFSAPITTGEKGNETPTGEFRITAFDSRHKSSMYFIGKTKIPYPMNYGLRFYTTKKGVSYWIHGRDLPGYPASHGCIGLYNEQMQKKYYGNPENPVLDDARILFEWVISPVIDDGKFHILKEGPKVLIIGNAPYYKK